MSPTLKFVALIVAFFETEAQTPVGKALIQRLITALSAVLEPTTPVVPPTTPVAPTTPAAPASITVPNGPRHA